ncbi:MAG: DUF2946 domain-containing protein [Gallionella sp.]|nr:DUF2946 domain-containing protein [Gallionella sp.]MDD4946515.1 DUF2946 domain-containing protein [Gallionella sp.]MDD5613231.1 DUF2946 domain-containing protein [Gallionella sp.]
MTHSARKFVAVLLALWLPLFSGSVMAASVTMQLDMGSSHHRTSDQTDESAMMDMQPGDTCDMAVVSPKVQDHAAAHDHQDHQCSACGICHLACSGYIAMSGLSDLSVQQGGATSSGYLLSFESTTSIPLLPPPLV